MPRKIQFKVVHVSGYDDDYGGRELEVHSPTTKGWQSTRFCVYPQEIVLMLKDPARLRKVQILSHQYLISSKIEIFSGSSPPTRQVSLLSCKFHRLGYVSLADNEEGNFKARELKSVNVDTDCHFIKLLVHKNHINRHNLYNQVNIVAVNVIGDAIEQYTDDNRRTDLATVSEGVEELIEQYMNNTDSELIKDPVVYGKINRPDYVSPLDDLAFDLYQDPETAQLIRRLEEKKNTAVLEERFDYAKKLKQAMADLYKVGEKLGKLEVEKKKAIEFEDYDLAKAKKLQSDEYRLYVYKQLDLYDLLELDKQHVQERYVPASPVHFPPPGILRSPRSPVLPAIEKRNIAIGTVATKSFTQQVSRTPTPEELPAELPVPGPEPEDRPLPVMKGKEQDTTGGIEETRTGDEALQDLSEEDEMKAALIIEVYGLPLVMRAYSKYWKYREEAMTTVFEELTSEKPELIAEKDTKSITRATAILLKRMLKGQVFTVFNECLKIVKTLFTSYIAEKKVLKGDCSYLIDKTFPALLKRTGDMAPRSRDAALSLMLELAALKVVKGLGIVPDLLTQPFKTRGQIPWRLIKSRIELIHSLMDPLGLDKAGGFTVDAIMKIILLALQHSHKDVREAAINCLFDLYRRVKERVKVLLPLDDPSTRKNPLYNRIFDGFNIIDGLPTEAERKANAKKKKEEADKLKKNELAALQAQLQALRNLAKPKEGDAETMSTTSKLRRVSGFQKAGSETLNIDKMCIFCGEQNDSFTEDNLDIHYWKSCPMLLRCTECPQVVEIPMLHDHLLSECEKKSQFSRCPRCKEAVLSLGLLEHTKANDCPEVQDKPIRCSLCQKKVLSQDEGWKKHLTEECKPNAKRLEQGVKANSKPVSNRGRGAQPRRRGPSRIAKLIK